MNKKLLFSILSLTVLNVAYAASSNRIVSIIQCGSNINYAIEGIDCNNNASSVVYTPSTEPWFIFAQSNGQLLDKTDVNDYGTNIVDFSNLGITDSNRPNKNFGTSSMLSINFDDNNLTNLDFFEGVDTITNYLSANSNGITDISGLSDIINTKTILSSGANLFLNNNNISDLSSISQIDELNQLELSNNNISDLSPLSGLKFKRLHLTNNNITDISMLNINSNVAELRFGGNDITDISNVGNAGGLSRLELYENSKITDISSLNTIPGIGHLIMHDIGVSNLSGLENFTSFLSLEINNLKNLENINALSNLTSVYFSVKLAGNPKLKDISPLKNLTSSGWVMFDDSSQYTTKFKDTDPFCIALNGGNVKSTTPYSEICIADTPPVNEGVDISWVDFLNDGSNGSYVYQNDGVTKVTISADTDITSDMILEIKSDESLIPKYDLGITSFTGDILIDGPTDVNFLRNLTSVNFVRIGGENNRVTDITGLENIIEINDLFYIDYPDDIINKAPTNSPFCQEIRDWNITVEDQDDFSLDPYRICE